RNDDADPRKPEPEQPFRLIARGQPREDAVHEPHDERDDPQRGEDGQPHEHARDEIALREPLPDDPRLDDSLPDEPPDEPLSALFASAGFDSAFESAAGFASP